MVHGLEGLKRIHHLAPCLEICREVAPEPQRDGGYGAGIGGDVVAHGPVATGDSLHQFAAPIGQPDGHAVVFEFTGISERGAVEQLAGAGLKVLYLLYTIGVAQRKHGQPMSHLAEGLVDLAPHTPAGRGGQR